jgi:hypothetical protein
MFTATHSEKFDHIILHYVGYGYHNRGVPFGLVKKLSELQRNFNGMLLTVFHELYASAPPWRSAFWLRPFQVHIARSIARLADAAVVSSETTLAELQRMAPKLKISVHPVVSNFGEPRLNKDELQQRDARRWVICGGTALVEQSLRSFRAIKDKIPEAFAPRHLIVIGGSDNPMARAIIADLGDLRVDYRPQIEVAEASRLLSTSSLAWLDYFHRPDAPMGAILKSTAFAAASAHGVVPVFPHTGSVISLDGDALPGPYYIDSNTCQLPSAADLPVVSARFFEWYQRHASSDVLAQGVASALFT